MGVIRHRTGNTTENNAQTLGPGQVTVDSEAHALRLHDGTTPGGYVILGPKVGLSGPGPQVLSAGTATHGYYGQVNQEQMVVTPSELTTYLGLTAGAVINPDSGWLKFSLDEKLLFIAQKPFRYALSWDDLNAVGAVDGSRTITLGDHVYAIRLIRGANTDPAYANHDSANPAGTEDSEWNRLVQAICSESGNTLGWDNFSAADLGAQGYTVSGPGTSNLCMERSGWNQANDSDSGYMVLRGYKGVDNYYVTRSNNDARYSGWRPVLELVT